MRPCFSAKVFVRQIRFCRRSRACFMQDCHCTRRAVVFCDQRVSSADLRGVTVCLSAVGTRTVQAAWRVGILKSGCWVLIVDCCLELPVLGLFIGVSQSRLQIAFKARPACWTASNREKIKKAINPTLSEDGCPTNESIEQLKPPLRQSGNKEQPTCQRTKQSMVQSIQPTSQFLNQPVKQAPK